MLHRQKMLQRQKRIKCCSAIRGNVTELPCFEWLARRPVVRNHHTSSKFVQMQHSKPKRPNFHLSLGPCVNGKIALPGVLGDRYTHIEVGVPADMAGQLSFTTMKREYASCFVDFLLGRGSRPPR
jgi:hypothetical protein